MSTDEPEASAPGTLDQLELVEPPDVDAPARRAPVQRRLLRRVLIALGALVTILALVVGGGIWYLTDRYAGNIDRIEGVFDGLDAGMRPAAPSPEQSTAEDPVTFLLVGTDTRETADEGVAEGGRADAIMLARFAGDRRQAQLISIPRDSWVDIPGHGQNKINAAYAFGGPTLLIQTVEQFTDVRIDHYVVIDFAGIIKVTDDLGGVDVVVAEATSNGPYTFPAGVNHLDGDQARWYLGQRYGLPGGDFDRVKRQQQFLRSVLTQLFDTNAFTDPGRLDAAPLAITSAVAVDDTLGNTDLLQLVYSLRDLRPEEVDSFTAPVLGTGREGAASVVYLDTVTCERMWAYLRSDSLGPNGGEFSGEALPDIPR